MLRQQQDEAYLASLRADQEKERKKREERERKRRKEEEVQQQKLAEERRRRVRSLALLPDPQAELFLKEATGTQWDYGRFKFFLPFLYLLHFHRKCFKIKSLLKQVQ